MPTYDYRCEANGRIVEVSHRMSEKMENWGQLCEKAGIDTGDTPDETPVTRMATGGNIIGASSGGGDLPPMPSCGSGGCGGGMCGLG
jgi:hypothetical protein